ncbi:MAG TPA: MFS transporter, partial [Ruminococcaceae bacterium]|nr:MFS transporter [Oscillospiraceae bacterium]
LGVAKPFLVYLAVMGAAGLFMPVIATTQTVFIQEITEPSMMGRVFSILQILSAGSVPFAILLFGPLADVVPIEGILLATGALMVLVAVLYRLSNKPAEEQESAGREKDG